MQESHFRSKVKHRLEVKGRNKREALVLLFSYLINQIFSQKLQPMTLHNAQGKNSSGRYNCHQYVHILHWCYKIYKQPNMTIETPRKKNQGIKIRAEKDGPDTKKTIQKSNKSKSSFIEKMNKTYKFLTRLAKK